ncbi:MAG: hypothetical protein ACQET5_12370 [Halobacteriota archaeon]|uniref:hypothetical protein n=1 Tax=Natronomonas sp. TaxID=2184060 RepID=UPI003976AA4F
MTTDEELRLAVDALGESILVVGHGSIGQIAATRIADSDWPAVDAAGTPDAAITAVDGSSLATTEASAGRLDPADVPIRFAVVTVPNHPIAGERAALDALAERVDAVIVASGEGAEDLAAAVGTLVSTVREPGVVNIDLADAETVFRSVRMGALCAGEDREGDPAMAVKNAFGTLATGIETDPVGGVLVDLVGPPGMSVTDVSEAVSTVRTHVGPNAHVIWGGSIDESMTDGIRARLVLAGVKNGRVAPDDRCPRCGASLSTYTFGDRTIPSCDSCGFAGVSVRLRD